MKRLVLIALLLTVWAAPLAAADKVIDRKRLVFRDRSDTDYSVAYEKFSNKPFTGIAQGWTEPDKGIGDQGSVYERRTYVDGLLHGPLLWFCGNGQLRRKNQFKRGNKVGKWLRYDWCDGHLSMVTDWGSGFNTTVTAKGYFRYPNNHKVEVINRFWVADNYVAYGIDQVVYDIDGNLIKEKRWDKNWKLIYEFPKK